MELTSQGATEIASHHADTPLPPASCTKLLTTAAAFEKYGPQASFKTVLYKLGESLLVVGGGDPGLGDVRLLAEKGLKPTAPFEAWAETLKAAGITTYRDLILDDRVFDQEFVHPSWPDDQRLAAYEAPIGGLNFNANCLDWIPKLTKNGVGVELMPQTSYVSVAIKAKRGDKQSVWLWRPADANTFEMRGMVAASATTPESVTIVEPVLWTGHVIRDTLSAAGVTCTGKVRRLAKTDDTTATQSVASTSTPLLSVIKRANKRSLNMMAEGLCKRLGYDTTKRPGSWENGTAVIEAYARACGVPAAQISLEDGSGLSAKNRVSAKAFTIVLAHIARRPDGQTFIDTLAVPGEDGSLRARFKNHTCAPGIHAKTGHIRGVSALSGYLDVETPKGKRRFAFSILCHKKTGNANPVQDDICQTLYNWAR